jgi:LysR family glycine cleavage system transcriptional activator/LysR family transcriptional regulator of beta-lactamase
MRNRLPLTALRAFDAAARNGSLTAAAAEQGVTRPAISKQIKLLEQMLKCTLMDRFGNTVRLTPAGQELSLSVGQAFDQIAAEANRLARGNAAANVIRILVDRDFASSFLAGHIGQFLVRNPGVSVEVVAERNGRLREDEDFNFRIFYGPHAARSYPGLREDVLCHWYDLTVCTPDYATQHVSNAGDLVDAQLLIDGNYDVWDDWFQQTGQRHPGTARHITHFNETSLCLSTAMSGGGITIGDSILAFPAIRAGRLVLPFRFGLESSQCYSIFLRTGARPTAAETAFRDWLYEVVRQHQTEVGEYLVENGITLVGRRPT